jgi:fatty-acyl-CoA synthase
VKGLTSDYQLTLPAMLKRAEALYGPKEIVTRRPDKSFHRYTYADFVTLDPKGYVKIQDRTKDLIKSGGEWISSVALENALMAHGAVSETAVIAIPDEKWGERPIGVVVPKEGEKVTEEELISLLAADHPKRSLPDAIEFVDEIPHTATGKALKLELRERYKNYTPAKG